MSKPPPADTLIPLLPIELDVRTILPFTASMEAETPVAELELMAEMTEASVDDEVKVVARVAPLIVRVPFPVRLPPS